jgi:hypothetical protein
MNLNGIASPLLEYALLAAGLGLCIYLFLSLKRDNWTRDQRWQKSLRPLEDSLQKLRNELEQIHTGLREVEERVSHSPALPPPKSGINLTTRYQVLRMSRRGERPEQIAAALSLPQNEVELLLKVHQLTVEG